MFSKSDEAQREYKIVEVGDVSSAYLPEMEKVLQALLPAVNPHFRDILSQSRDERGRIRAQIFVGLCEDRVAGLVQIFYRQWRNNLVANVDVLGVLEPFRRTNLGIVLMRQAISAAMKVSAQYKLPVVGVVWLVEPDQGPLDSWPVRRVRMFEKMGGQVRRDLRYRYEGQSYPDGELIFWYPLCQEFSDVDTKSLAWLLWQFGQLPEKEFARRYGQLDSENIHQKSSVS